MKNNWYSMRAVGNGVGELRIYGPVGDSFFSESVSASQVWDELQALGPDIKQIDVYINSPGGSVFDGMTIVNQLKRHPATINTYVEGIAASMASVIAISGDKCCIYDNAMLMIHHPSGSAYGNAGDLRNVADVLDKISNTVANMYAKKSGQDVQCILDMMSKEQYMTGAEAKALGFVDEVIETVAAAAALNAAKHFDFSMYSKQPPFMQPKTAPSHQPKPNATEKNPMSKAILLSALATAMSAAISTQRTQQQLVEALAKATALDAAVITAAIAAPQAETALTEENIKLLEAALKALPAPVAQPVAITTLSQCKTLEEAYALGARMEVARVKGVRAQALPGHEDLVAEMMFDGNTTPEQASMRILAAERAAMATGLDLRRQALQQVPARPVVPNAGGSQLLNQLDDDALANMSVDERAKAKWDADAKLKAEFDNDFSAYLAYEKANSSKLVKVLKK